MKTLAVLLGVVAFQERLSPDLLDYEPLSSLSGSLELGPPLGFENLLTRWGNRMKQHYPDLRGGQTESTPLSTPRALTTGSSRFGVLPRRWSENELEDFRIQWGYYPIEIVVGADAIRLVVHPDNPIRSLTLGQLDSMFSSGCRRGGKAIRSWGDLGLFGEWKQRPLALYGMVKGTPAWSIFKDRVLQGGGFDESVREQSSAENVLLRVADDPCAIGYLSGGVRSGDVRVVPLPSASGGAAIEPRPDTILTLSYPLAWRLYVDLRRSLRGTWDPELVEFVKMILSLDGQSILATEGLVPISGRAARKELQKLLK
jgi:phosphate transport system substrate-binding protein